MLFVLDHLAIQLDLIALFGVPELLLRLNPGVLPAPDFRAIRGPHLFKQQIPAGIQQVAGSPLKAKRHDERSAGLQVQKKAADHLACGGDG